MIMLDYNQGHNGTKFSAIKANNHGKPAAGHLLVYNIFLYFYLFFRKCKIFWSKSGRSNPEVSKKMNYIFTFTLNQYKQTGPNGQTRRKLCLKVSKIKVHPILIHSSMACQSIRTFSKDHGLTSFVVMSFDGLQ